MSTKYRKSKDSRRRYNPYISKHKGLYYIILNKISIYKSVSKKGNRMQSSFMDNLKINLFTVSEEVEHEYSMYRLRKNSYKKRVKKFSFYNTDGSYNCIGIFLGMCADDDYVKEKSFEIFYTNLEKIVQSKDFADLLTLLFSCSVFVYFYFSFFFNFVEYINHSFKF